MLEKIITKNFITIIAILFSFITLKYSKGLNKKTTLFFIGAMILSSILIVIDSLDYYFSESFEIINNWRYVTTIIGYSIKPGLILIIIITFLRYDEIKRKMILSIPLLINGIICISSPFTHWVFYFLHTNSFNRGPLGFLPFLTSGIYLIILISLMIKKLKIIDIKEIILVGFISLTVVSSVALEIVIGDKFLINGAGVLCIIFYYMYLYIQSYRRDSLTGLLNRNSFYNETENISSDLYIVCLDMNNLKEVNDNYGHLAGDKALLKIANAIRNNISKKDEAYRVGGDEFTLLLYGGENEIIEVIKKINLEVIDNGYSIAVGYEYFDGKTDFEKIYNSADQKMYINKRAMKMTQNKE